jgi:signal transduction histidine kinase
MGFQRFLSSRSAYATHLASDFTKINGNEVGLGMPTGTSAVPRDASPDTPEEEWLAQRKRLAQELHDTLLQGFLAVSMQLHTAVDQLPAECPAKGRFATTLRLMDRVLEEGRCTVQGLSSSQKFAASLGQDLAEVPMDLGLPTAVGFRVVVEGRHRELRAGLRDELYRIGREAIFNAYRHSRATNIETEIEYRPTELRIAVRDDGCGIDPQRLHQMLQCNGHWGLHGMRERAERIGARLRILSKVTLGTEIELSVPSRIAFEQGEARAAAY